MSRKKKRRARRKNKQKDYSFYIFLIAIIAIIFFAYYYTDQTDTTTDTITTEETTDAALESEEEPQNIAGEAAKRKAKKKKKTTKKKLSCKSIKKYRTKYCNKKQYKKSKCKQYKKLYSKKCTKKKKVKGKTDWKELEARVYKNNPRTSIITYSLRHLDRSGYLKGTYIDEVRNIQKQRKLRKQNRKFIYSPVSQEFGEVMAYYCSDKLLSYLDEHFSEYDLPKIRIRTYDSNVRGSAGYDVPSNTAAVGIPDRSGKDPNKDCSIYTHEIFHLFFFANYDRPAVDAQSVGTVGWMVGEGYAHFLATSFQDVLFQDNEESIESVYLYPNFDLDNNIRLPYELPARCDGRGCKPIHKAIAGIFWDIRKSIGKDKAHRLIFKSWKNLPKGGDQRRGDFLTEAFYALAEADQELYGGRHHDNIKRAFENHSEFFYRHRFGRLPRRVPR